MAAARGQGEPGTVRVHLTFVFEGDDAEDAGPATIANVNQRVPCHAALVEWARGELANNMPRVRMGSIKWSDDAARRQREKAWIEAGPVKTPPSTLWSTDGSAEAASMQGCTVTFWDPVAFFNADLSDTRVQCPKCHGTKGIERSSMGHLRRIACAGRTRYVIGEKMKCRGADQKGCPGSSPSTGRQHDRQAASRPAPERSITGFSMYHPAVLQQLPLHIRRQLNVVFTHRGASELPSPSTLAPENDGVHVDGPACRDHMSTNTQRRLRVATGGLKCRSCGIATRPGDMVRWPCTCGAHLGNPDTCVCKDVPWADHGDHCPRPPPQIPRLGQQSAGDAAGSTAQRPSVLNIAEQAREPVGTTHGGARRCSRAAAGTSAARPGAAFGATAATTSASPAAAATAADSPPLRPIRHLHSDPLALPRQPLLQQVQRRQHRRQQPAVEQHQPPEGQQQPQTCRQVLPPRSLQLPASVAQQQSPRMQPLPLQLQRPQSTLQMAADAAQPPAAAGVGAASAEILGGYPRAHDGAAGPGFAYTGGPGNHAGVHGAAAGVAPARASAAGYPDNQSVGFNGAARKRRALETAPRKFKTCEHDKTGHAWRHPECHRAHGHVALNKRPSDAAGRTAQRPSVLNIAEQTREPVRTTHNGAASGATAATTSASPAAAATAAGFPPSRPIWHLHSDPLALPRQPLVQQMSLPQPQQQGLQSLQPRGVQRQHRHQQPALEQHQPSEGQQQPQTRSQVLPPRSLHLLASVALATVAQQQSPQLQPLPLQLQRPQSTLQMAADAAQPPAAARVGTASAEILGSRPRAHDGAAGPGFAYTEGPGAAAGIATVRASAIGIPDNQPVGLNGAVRKRRALETAPRRFKTCEHDKAGHAWRHPECHRAHGHIALNKRPSE